MSHSQCPGAHVIIGRLAPNAAAKTDSSLAARLAAFASLGAAVIHLAVAPTLAFVGRVVQAGQSPSGNRKI